MTLPYRYCGFGLDFQSAIPMAELREAAGGPGDPVAIRIGSAPCPDGMTLITNGVAAGPQDFWMDVPDTMRLHVADGSCMTIEPAPDASMNVIRSYLLGSGIGALLHQRGLLPLHASAVEIDGVAAVFCGPSGAGKSSLALHLVKRRHRLLCDDICAIDMASGAPRVWPGLVNLKLWRESLATVGEPHADLQPVLPGTDKYKLPIEDLASNRSYALGHLFFLGVSDQRQPTATAMAGSSAMAALVANTFRGQLVGPMNHSRQHFEHSMAVIAATNISLLSRAWSMAEMAATCQLIETTIRSS